MNILFLSTENPYPPNEGHHIRTLNILKGLAQNNNIHFIGFARHEKELQYSKYLEGYCKTIYIYMIPQGFFKWRLFASMFFNLFSPLPYTAGRYIHKEAKRKIKQIIEEYNIDLVHCDMLHLGVYTKEIYCIPRVITNHNVESLRMLRWFKVEKNIFIKLYLCLQYLKLYNFEKKICPKYDKCVTVSEYDKNVLLKMCGKDNFVVIPNGVDSEYFSPSNGEIHSKSLIWTGGMDGAYNRDAVDYFLDDILPLIQSNIPNIRVSFIGKEPTKKLIKTSRDNSNIRVEGFVDDIRPYVDKATVFIAPLRSGSGTKIKVLNALSQAKVVVTTSIGVEGIEATDNENIMIADDPKQFAEKITYILNNPEKARLMGLKARKLIEEKYDWKIINNKVNEIYENIIQPRE